MQWLAALLAAIGNALAAYFAKRASDAATIKTTADDAVQAAANETATVVEETADARSQLHLPDNAVDLAAELRRRAAEAGGGGGTNANGGS